MKQVDIRHLLSLPVSSLDQQPSAVEKLGRRICKNTRHVQSGLSQFRSKLTLTPKRPLLNFSEDAEILIIVPPFAPLYVPSLAAHTLQGWIERSGTRLHVLYVSILLASEIGEDAYNEVSWELLGPFVAERLFARSAFDLPPLGQNAEEMFTLPQMFGEKQANIYGRVAPYVQYSETQQRSIHRFRALEERMNGWLDSVADAVCERNYSIIGCTSTFEQILSSVALLNKIKRRRPDIITVVGGANCDGEMAEGIALIGTGIDFVFSGESDVTFPAFVKDALEGRLHTSRIVKGKPWSDMDATPTPRFDEFFSQRSYHMPYSRRSAFLTYETSRGCWWGQKQHCTFCGLNADGMASRRKSADRVLEELTFLTREYGIRNIAMTDAIMPHEYFNSLLPRLSKLLPGLTVFYEQKANLTLAQVLSLKESGITAIQPGIESLSSPMLQRMKKGLHAWQNLMLLRYSRMTGVRLWWSILCGFPGDREDDYLSSVKLARLIHHLPPPVTMWHLMIDRFSPYHMRPADFGIRSISPYPAYRDFLPENIDPATIAYHFVADYDSAADRNPDMAGELAGALYDWRMAWHSPYGKRPELKIERTNGDFALIDTRGLPGTERVREIDFEYADFLLVQRRYENTERERQAVEEKLAVVVDEWFVPLAIARIDLMYDVLQQCPEAKLITSQMEEVGLRRDSQDVRRGLVNLACSGSLSCLEHPLTPP